MGTEKVAETKNDRRLMSGMSSNC